jgi:hypothetical protein
MNITIKPETSLSTWPSQESNIDVDKSGIPDTNHKAEASDTEHRFRAAKEAIKAIVYKSTTKKRIVPIMKSENGSKMKEILITTSDKPARNVKLLNLSFLGSINARLWDLTTLNTDKESISKKNSMQIASVTRERAKNP